MEQAILVIMGKGVREASIHQVDLTRITDKCFWFSDIKPGAKDIRIKRGDLNGKGYAQVVLRRCCRRRNWLHGRLYSNMEAALVWYNDLALSS